MSGPAAPASHTTPRREFWRGARAAASPLIGTSMWGLVVGVSMVKTGLTVPEAIAMSILVYAGSAQLAALPLIAAGVPVGIVLFTALVINLRFLIYSAALAPYFQHLTLRWKLLLGYLSGDIAAAVFMQDLRTEEERIKHGAPVNPLKHWFFLGPSAIGWCTWQIAGLTGIVLGAGVPAEWGLGFAGTIVLGGLAIAAIHNLGVAAGLLTSMSVALATNGLPLRLGLVVAVIAGVSVALGVETWMERRAAARAKGERAP